MDRSNYKITSLFFFIFLFSKSLPTFAFDLDPIGERVKRGVENYKNKKYRKAMENFSNAEKEAGNESRIQFNKGTAQYKMKNYRDAIKSFESSAKSKDRSLRARSQYNLGNTYHQLGDNEMALKSYLNALGEDANFEPARKNLELLRKKVKQQQNNQQEKSGKDKKGQANQEPASDKKKRGNENQKPQIKPEQSDRDEMKKNQEKASQKDENELSRDEAERILESARRHEGIKRKQNNSMFRKNKSGKFW